MPAYFEMSLQFQQKDFYPGFMVDFNAHLSWAGLRFSSGFLKDEGLSQVEIADWNQKQMEKDFKLGWSTCHLSGYKQMLYKFEGYTEVRGYWACEWNRCLDSGLFTYFIIIPESEVADEDDYAIFCPDKTVQLRKLAERLWQFPAVKAIQTGVEENDHTKLRELRKGAPASVCPLAIVERDCHPYDDGSRVIKLTQGRPGFLLLENDDFPA